MNKQIKCPSCKIIHTPLMNNGIVRTRFCLTCFLEKNKKKYKIKKKKEWKIEKKILKEGLKSHSDYLKYFESLFNRFIRLRDEDEPCISCKTRKDVEYAAGHYYPAGNYSYLRFNEDNVHKQCNSHCNCHLGGNLQEYRINLIKKIGIERVEELDRTRNFDMKLTIPEIKEQIIIYKQKCKDYEKRV